MKDLKRAVRIFLYVFIPSAIGVFTSMIEKLDWRSAPLLAAAASAVGTTWRHMNPDLPEEG